MDADLFSACLAHLKKLAFTTSQYSTPLNPVIESGASYQPGFRAPQLRRGIQKNSGETTMPVEKTSASAPTRGNFMMASDLPAFRAPQLRVGVQKEGDMLPDGVTYGPSDFKKSKYAVSREWVEQAVQQARVSRPRLREFASKAREAAESLPPGASQTKRLAGYAEARARDFGTARFRPQETSDVLMKGRQEYPKLTRPLEAHLRSPGRQAQAQKMKGNTHSKSKYAMPTEDLEAYVAWLRKEADVSPAVTWSGATGVPHRQESNIPPFRAPRLDRGIQKQSAVLTPATQLAKTQRIGAPKATAPAGPSIADISKPKGARFGTGIAGAFKTGIGGTGPVGLK